MKTILAVMLVTTLTLTPLIAADEESTTRLKDAASVFAEVTAWLRGLPGNPVGQ